MNRFLCLLLVLLLCFSFCGCKQKPPKNVDKSTPPEEIYEFLNTEYIVTSKLISFDIVYECNYYFNDGTVAGEKQMTTFPTEDEAELFYESLLKEYPDAQINGTTVTIYTDDEDETFYGCTLEKLIFNLELANYELSYTFDKDTFLEEYGEEE